MSASLAQILSLLVPVLAIALIARRNMRGRKLRLERLWLFPVLMACAAALLLAQGPPPGPLAMALYAAALVAGGVIGWWRGRFTRVIVDPQTHEITSQSTPAGLALIVAVFAARYALRFVLLPGGAAGSLHISATRVTDALILFAVGVMAVQRIEVGVRARRMLLEARAAKAKLERQA